MSLEAGLACAGLFWWTTVLYAYAAGRVHERRKHKCEIVDLTEGGS
jgi:hypothetical protein